MSEVFLIPGVSWVALAALLAGLVYGFAGFGAALIFMPLATIFLEPAVAIAGLSVSALASLVTVVPGAWAAADKRQTVLMVGTSLVFMPLGIALLGLVSEPTIRTAISGLTLITLMVLLLGWKITVRGKALPLGVAALAGITGGSTGLNGPPVILFNLGSDQPVAVTRGNLACFLTLNGVFLLPMMLLLGAIDASAALLGLVLLVPYGLGTWAGTQVFDPANTRLYRRAAYGLIGASGLLGLPIWG